MGDAIELASTVLTVGISTQGVGRDLLATVKGLGGQVAGLGKTAGGEYSKNFNTGSKGATKAAEADQGKLKQAVTDAGQAVVKARTAEGDAARKVKLEEQKLTELRESGKAKASQVLAAEERVLMARRNLAVATDKASTEQRAYNKAHDEFQRETTQSTQATQTFSEKLKAVATGKLSLKGAFAKVPAEAAEAGGKSGESFSSKMSDSVKGGVGKMGGLLKAGLIGAVAAAGISLGSIFSDAIAGGSNLEQSIGGVQAVFKDQSAEIEKAAKGASSNLNMSRNAYNELATTLGAGLKNKGIQDFTGETQKLIGLGADLAAQFGGSTTEAVEAISSLMRGEADPIERYGVAINETAVNAELAARGQSKLTGAALEAAKAQARVDLLMRQTADAQGAAAREADTFASKQARWNAKWEEFTTGLGTRALPMISGFMDVILGGLGGLDEFVKGLDGITSILFSGDFIGADLTFGLEEDDPIINTLFRIRDGFGGILSIFKDGDFIGADLTFGLEEDDPIVGVLFAIRDGALGIWDAFVGLFDVVRPIALDIWDLLVKKWGEIGPAVDDIFTSIGGIVNNWMTIVRNLIERVTTALRWIWDNWGSGILSILEGIWDAAVGIFRGAYRIIEGVTDIFAGIFTGDTDKMMQGVNKIFEGAFIAIEGIFTGAVKALGGIWDGIKNTFAGPVNWVIDNVLNPLIRKINEIASGFGLKLNIPTVPRVSGPTTSTKGGGGAGGGMVAMAGGGILSGYRPFQRGDDQMVAMRSGEGVSVSEAMRSPFERERLLALNEAYLTGKTKEFYAKWGGGLAHMAGGGIVPNARQGFGGYDPVFLRAIQAWASATGRTWSMTGNGGARSFADQKRAWDLSQSGRGPLAANPWKGGPHMVPGIAMDLSPRPGEIASAAGLLGRFGLGLTVRGEPWHVGKLGGRSGGVTPGGGGGGGWSLGLAGMIDAALGLLPKPQFGGAVGQIVGALPGFVARKAAEGIEGMLTKPNAYAAGTLSAAPGLAWVGERGPELVNFAGGERVYSAEQSSLLTAEEFERIVRELLAEGVNTTITGADHVTGLMAARLLTAIQTEGV